MALVNLTYGNRTKTNSFHVNAAINLRAEDASKTEYMMSQAMTVFPQPVLL